MPLLLKPEEAARELGISRSKLFDLLATGEIGSIKIGRCRRIPSSSLDSYIKSRIGQGRIERL